jgi:hypothetical protein
MSRYIFFINLKYLIFKNGGSTTRRGAKYYNVMEEDFLHINKLNGFGNVALPSCAPLCAYRRDRVIQGRICTQGSPCCSPGLRPKYTLKFLLKFAKYHVNQ